MCGISGFWDRFGQVSSDRLPIIVQQMSNALFHRGPDDSGIWVDASVGLALGHRRLSIVDLSPLGHQPMLSSDGRYVIVFNGEIYNFLELRGELEKFGHRFRGHSDTEVMQACFSQWGVHAAVKRFNGMFAFALWDKVEQVFYLGRDRIGEKPLYYGFSNQTFLFASELKALKVHPDFQGEIDRNALASFLRYGYIPAPHSIYKGIYKLPPGTLLSWNGTNAEPQIVPYWSATAAAQTGVNYPFTGSEKEAVESLETLLKDAVAMRMIVDVPLGAFLSGGIDSSIIVALMQAQSCRSVKTFSIGFHEQEYNEAEHAKTVAHYLGCDHTEFYVTPEDALAVIPKLPSLYDEPFADISQIPTFLVSQLARQHVTVSLSGDAGDELFAGYKRYLLCRNIWQKIGWMPVNVRHIIARSFKSATVIPATLKRSKYSDKLNKLAEILLGADADAMYANFISFWKNTEELVINSSEPIIDLKSCNYLAHSDLTLRMMSLDQVTYLPDDILVKVDRASMGVSLESRIPFLDHRVVEFAWHIPMSMKIRNGQGKWLLRQVLYKYVPQPLVERPKMGFDVPIHSWLRGPLQDWAEDLLDESRLLQQGFLNPKPILEKWAEHKSGIRNWEYHLWNILMFQAWLEKHY